MRRQLTLIAVVVASVVASPTSAQSTDSTPDTVHVYREIHGRALHAYVFQPAGHRASDRAPAILLFHGGGWSAGEAAWTFPTARRFADSGLVAIAVEYRLSVGDVTPVDALADACNAFRWVREHAHDLGLSGRVAGYGVSAGGHLVAATVTVGCPDGSAGATSGPDALLLWSPALDVVNDRWFVGLLRGRTTAVSLSPARHVTSSTPPTSVVHGEKDTLTPLAGVQRYCARLAELGKICEMHVYPGVGHLLTRNLRNQESDFDPDPEARADGIARHHAFLGTVGFVAVGR